tara:strand:+ start:11484 stop:12548 length:1065 start_codon:yes stop_codon:yes gene_type:complete
MLTNHFYHEIIRKTIVSFGTLFNNIEIQHKDKAGSVVSVVKVPISYGPQQKFLARVTEGRDYQGGVAKALTLPRMSFEVIGMNYDSTRKVSTMQTFKAVNKNTNKMIKGYMPVPYNINMQMSILAKLNEDAIQILEQILPYFQPAFNLTIDLVSIIGEKRDMPITLEGISMEDNYEDDYLTRRALIYTLNFTCKTFLFGPINNSSEGLIKKVQTDFYSDTTNLKTAPRQVRYQAVPVAVKDYNQDDTARTNEVFDDKVTSFGVNSSTPFAKGNFIQIDDEVMLISSINANRLTVKRGQYGTAIVPHDINIPVNAITIQDNEAIVDGDDFGFGVTKSEYADGQVFSISQQTDAEL